MDKSSITWTRGSDWWLSRTTMSGKERYPKQIRVGNLDRPRVYYPVDRDALEALADEIDADADRLLEEPKLLVGATGLMRCYAYSIREALGASDG